MHTIRFEPSGRSMRWYEWLSGLLLLSLAFGARAGSVCKCVDASSAAAFQDRPCAAAQEQSEVEIAPAPVYAPPPKYAVETRTQGANYRASRAQSRFAHATAYECRTSDGCVFYRLGTCPRSLAVEGGGTSRGNGRSRGGGAAVSVSGHPVPREDARMQMRRADSIGRSGREYDEHISTYDKNLGRDPCA